MSSADTRQTDVVIAGGGLAGIVAAHELLGSGQRVLLIDQDRREKFGGLARESAGGVCMIDTPYQRRQGMEDSAELAWKDWQRVADYDADDLWPRRWGQFFCENSMEYVYEFLDGKKIRFVPVVNWAERGTYGPGNTLPRWHMVWGLGVELIDRLVAALDAHPNRRNLEILFDTEVTGIELTGDRAIGVRARGTDGQREIRIAAEHVIIAAGGICGGDLSTIRAHWYKPWGPPPNNLLNGGHIHGDGRLHHKVAELGGVLTHLDLHWLYPTGIHHPKKRRPDDGLSLVAPRSALWFNGRGERIMTPGPMAAYGDTRQLVATVLGQPGQYSWQVLNWKIAIRELTASGPDYLTAIRNKSWLGLAAMLVFGNKKDTRRLLDDCPEDIVVADTFEQLAGEMEKRSVHGVAFDRAKMLEAIRAWDDMIDRGPAYHNDDQLRRIANCRTYRGDRARTCNFQKILDPKARPLIAIRECIVTRKSLGGIQTDLQCRVLRAADGEPIPGLYAVGEAAGFGGGGIHGKGSLEGTFLAGCVLTGRVLGRSLHSS